MNSAQLRKKIQELLNVADERLLRMVYAVMKEYEASGFDWTVHEQQAVYQRKGLKTGVGATVKRGEYVSSDFVVSEEDKKIAYERAMDIIEGREKGLTREEVMKSLRAALKKK